MHVTEVHIDQCQNGNVEENITVSMAHLRGDSHSFCSPIIHHFQTICISNTSPRLVTEMFIINVTIVLIMIHCSRQFIPDVNTIKAAVQVHSHFTYNVLLYATVW